jgi:hypothetical protein
LVGWPCPLLVGWLRPLLGWPERAVIPAKPP